jgi:hypothetical protein
VRECHQKNLDSQDHYVALVLEERQVLVERDDVSVMFKRVADEPNEIGRGMAEVEEIVGLRGRKYYGAFDDNGEYRVCVQLREGDDPQAFGLEVGTLPGRSLCACAPYGRAAGDL